MVSIWKNRNSRFVEEFAGNGNVLELSFVKINDLFYISKKSIYFLNMLGEVVLLFDGKSSK